MCENYTKVEAADGRGEVMEDGCIITSEPMGPNPAQPNTPTESAEPTSQAANPQLATTGSDSLTPVIGMSIAAALVAAGAACLLVLRKRQHSARA